MSVPYQQNIDQCFTDTIGSTGLDRSRYNEFLGETEGSLASLRAAHDDGSLPLLRFPAKTSDMDSIEAVAERYIESFDDVIVLGIGGSSLGGQMLVALTSPAPTGQLTDTPRIHFMDNIDPHSFDVLFAAVEPTRTAFIVISKSGGTAETLTQFLFALDVFGHALGKEALSNHFTIITEPGDNPLRRIAEAKGFETLDHDTGVGGRYSALTNVGLLPATIAGIDASAVRDGAQAVINPILNGISAMDCAPANGAALSIALMRERGLTSTVLMPYVDRLAYLGFWYQQLWAESLGKNGSGTTPLRAVGTVDQHSQLQLYLDGPRDKMFTLIFNNSAGVGGTILPNLADDPALAYLSGRRMGDLLDAEQRATAETLAKNGCPTRLITVDAIDERSVGALMMHFMLETIIAADLLGVDAFDQPAVEEGKVLARQFLGAMD